MYKFIVVALICSLIIIYLRNISKELAILCEIMSGIIVIIFAFDYLTDTFSFLNALVTYSGLDKSVFRILIKIIGIGYLVEFTARIIDDFGIKGLSDKVVFVGKILIFSISIPIFYAFINLIESFLL